MKSLASIAALSLASCAASSEHARTELAECACEEQRIELELPIAESIAASLNALSLTFPFDLRDGTGRDLAKAPRFEARDLDTIAVHRGSDDPTFVEYARVVAEDLERAAFEHLKRQHDCILPANIHRWREVGGQHPIQFGCVLRDVDESRWHELAVRRSGFSE